MHGINKSIVLVQPKTGSREVKFTRLMHWEIWLEQRPTVTRLRLLAPTIGERPRRCPDFDDRFCVDDTDNQLENNCTHKTLSFWTGTEVHSTALYSAHASHNHDICDL